MRAEQLLVCLRTLPRRSTIQSAFPFPVISVSLCELTSTAMLARLRGRSAAPPPTDSEALSELRAALSQEDLSQSPSAQSFLTDACLLRYLRARSLSVSKSLSLLQHTLSWRASYRPHFLLSSHLPELRSEAASGKMFVLPEPDRLNRAVIVMRPGLENSEDPVANIRYLVYTLERAAALSEVHAGDGKFTVLVDYFTGTFSVRNCPSIAVMKETTTILQNHYPERLGAMFFYDAPMFLLGMLRVIRPFIDPVTRDKLFFVKSKDASEDQDVKRLLDLERTPVEYGGILEYQFQPEHYFESDNNVYA